MNFLEFLQAQALAKKCIVHYTSEDPQKRANAAFLISSYAVSSFNSIIFVENRYDS